MAVKLVVSGGDVGGAEVEFPTGEPGDHADVQIEGGRFARYEVRMYPTTPGRQESVAVFVGYIEE